MKIEKNVILKALEAVKPGLASKEQITQSTAFVFTDGKVVTYNDEISTSFPLEVGFEGAINSTELYGFLKKCKTKEIELSKKKNELEIKSGRAQVWLVVQDEIVLPFNEIGNIKKWKKLPDNFLEGLQFAMGSCGNNNEKPKLKCVHVNQGVIEGSDGFKIAQFKLIEEAPAKNLLIPAANCSKIISMFPEEMSVGKSWVHFKDKEGAILSCRILEEKEYVDTDKFLKSKKGIEFIFPENTLDLIEKAGVFAKRENLIDERIGITFEEKELKISSKGDFGRYEERAKSDYKGDKVKFTIPPYLLRDILKQSHKCKKDGNKLIFEGENWKFLTLLLS